MIYLYVKIHNITGLKYLGKTVQDPFVYNGSGKRWLNHLKKHGVDITTEILFQTEDKDIFKQKAIYYSNLYNIVESDDWANIRPEEGDGGDTSQYIDYVKVEAIKKHRKDLGHYKDRPKRVLSEQTKSKMSKTRTGQKRGPYKPYVRKKRGPYKSKKPLP
jgi:hypothetical protein